MRWPDHAAMLLAMRDRLSSRDFPALSSLRTRDPNDPSIALLDAWATVGDVLYFYHARFSEEGYLRSAKEPRSLLELTRLIGYMPRPGVAASAFLAYTIDKDAAPVEIPRGARANTVPGPDEQMQAFETTEPMLAKQQWNLFAPRTRIPQDKASIIRDGLFVKGIDTRLRVNDPLLLDLADGFGLRFVRALSVELDSANGWTRVRLDFGNPAERLGALKAYFGNDKRFDLSSVVARRFADMLGKAAALAAEEPEVLPKYIEKELIFRLDEAIKGAFARGHNVIHPYLSAMRAAIVHTGADIPPTAAVRTGGRAVPSALSAVMIEALAKPAAAPSSSATALIRDPSSVFSPRADGIQGLIGTLQPERGGVYAAMRGLAPAVPSVIRAMALRISAGPFGHNAPLRQTNLERPEFGEWNIGDPLNQGLADPKLAKHDAHTIYLDGVYDVLSDNEVVVERPDCILLAGMPARVQGMSIAAYGLSGRTTRLDLRVDWLNSAVDGFEVVRGSRVHAGTEALQLVDVPLDEVVGGDDIELDGVVEGLEAGRWLVVSGERSDIASGKPGEDSLSGIRGAELVLLSGVEHRLRTRQGEAIPGDTLHSHLLLSPPLAYRYRRETVRIHGNVVHATHGEACDEVLGSGDASIPNQRFALRQAPLTWESAASPDGLRSSLDVRVNTVRWRASTSPLDVEARSHTYSARAELDKVSVVFGDGVRGARPATGIENIRAKYRKGIGKCGNAAAGQISLLHSRPLGVSEVVNPIRASGGADADPPAHVARIAPLSLFALERLVSVDDHARFARLFAGVGKASARLLSNGHREVVHVTIAGVDDAPIEPSSDLFRNLRAAFHKYGDPALPVSLGIRERLAVTVSARIKVAGDHDWALLEPIVRAAILRVFAFDRVELGSDLLLSDLIVAVQEVPGVVYVDVDAFDAFAISDLVGIGGLVGITPGLRARIPVAGARLGKNGQLAPAQVAHLDPTLRDAVILREVAP